MPLLQGCFLLAGLAALGGGGYYIGAKAGQREEERVKTESLIEVKKELDQKGKIQAQADQNITNQISQNYVAGTLTSSIAVYPEVRNGVVILHGRVPDEATARRAIETARKTPGVQRIISNLVIMNQAPAQVQSAYPQAAPQVPQQYQQQYQQYLQQQYQQQQMQMQQQRYAPQPQQYQQQNMYQQPAAAPGQSSQMKFAPNQLQPKVVAAAAPNKSAEKKSQLAAKVEKKDTKQVASKEKPKQQNTPPPQKQEAKSEPPKQSPRILPDKMIDYYAEDNDSGYKEYYPKKIKKTSQAKAQPVKVIKQKEVVFVPVPVPSYEYDADADYRNVGAYNPTPLIYTHNPAPVVAQPQIPVPTPTETEDYDNRNELMYYQ